MSAFFALLICLLCSVFLLRRHTSLHIFAFGAASSGIIDPHTMHRPIFLCFGGDGFIAFLFSIAS